MPKRNRHSAKGRQRRSPEPSPLPLTIGDLSEILNGLVGINLTPPSDLVPRDRLRRVTAQVLAVTWRYADETRAKPSPLQNLAMSLTLLDKYREADVPSALTLTQAQMEASEGLVSAALGLRQLRDNDSRTLSEAFWYEFILQAEAELDGFTNGIL